MNLRPHSIALVVILVALVVVPLAGGGTLLLGWSGRLFAAGLLAAIAGVALLRSRLAAVRPSLAAVLLIALLALVLLQLVRLPMPVVQALSPGRARLARLAVAESTQAPVAVALTVDRAATADAWMGLACLTVFFLAVLHVVTTRRRALQATAALLAVLGAAAVLAVMQQRPDDADEAIYNRFGLAAYTEHPNRRFDPTMPRDQGAGYGRLAPQSSVPATVAPGDRPVLRLNSAMSARDDLLFLQAETRTPDIFGPFTTADAFGAWLLLTAPLLAALLAVHLATRRRYWTGLLGCLTTRHGNLTLLLLLAAPLLAVLTLVYLPPLLSLLAVAQAVLVCAAAAVGRPWRRVLRGAVIVIVVLGATVLALYYSEPVPGQSAFRAVALPRVAQRLQTARLGASAGLAMWRDAPWTGLGLGAYHRVYPLYATARFDRLMHYGHCLPATLLAEVGILGTGLFALAFLLVLVRGVVAWARSADPWFKHLLAGLVAGILGLAVWSCMSAAAWNPAVQLALAASMGLLFAMSSWHRAPAVNDRRDLDVPLPAGFRALPGQRTSALALGLLLLVAGLGLWAAAAASTVSRRIGQQVASAASGRTTARLQWQQIVVNRAERVRLRNRAYNLSMHLRWDSDLRVDIARLSWQLAWPGDFASVANLTTWVAQPPLTAEARALTHSARSVNPLNLAALHQAVGLNRALQLYSPPTAEATVAQLREDARRAMVVLRQLAPRNPMLQSRLIQNDLERLGEIGRFAAHEGNLVVRLHERLALMLDVDDPELFRYGMQLLLETGAYEQVRDVIPDTVVARQRAASYLHVIRQAQESRTEAARAVELGDPLVARRLATPEVFEALARAHLLLDEPEQALPHALQAAAAGPTAERLVLGAELCVRQAAAAQSAAARQLLAARGYRLLERAEALHAAPAAVARLRNNLDSVSVTR